MNKRVQLLLLAAVFFLPLAVAWTWFFCFKDVRPGTVIHGVLVEPVVPLADMTLSQRGAAEPVAPFRDEWFVVILAPRDCGTDCERVLYVTRQVWIRLNKDADRVQRVLLAGPGVQYAEDEHVDLKVFALDERVLERFTDTARPELAGAQRIYLVDPQGNLMMSYPLDLSPDMLSKDLKRLLRYSNGG